MAPAGMTNLWDGLKKGMDCLAEGHQDRGYKGNSAVFLLTDGEPNIDPPRGILPVLSPCLRFCLCHYSSLFI